MLVVWSSICTNLHRIIVYRKEIDYRTLMKISCYPCNSTNYGVKLNVFDQFKKIHQNANYFLDLDDLQIWNHAFTAAMRIESNIQKCLSCCFFICFNFYFFVGCRIYYDCFKWFLNVILNGTYYQNNKCWQQWMHRLIT